MFTLVIKDLDTSEILNLDFYHIRDCGYELALHFDEDSGLFNLLMSRKEAFSVRIADNTLYITGDLELAYYGTCLYYREQTLKSALEEME